MNDISTATELVVIDPADALAIFTGEKPIAPILQRIRTEIDGFQADLSTPASRKAIASMAFKVTRSKTYLDDVGKKLVDEQKKIPNKIDATRRHVRDTLDTWRDEVRKPLTDWEAAEDDRVERIKASLAELQGIIDDRDERTSDAIRDRLREVEAEAVTEQFYGEYLDAAHELKTKAVDALRLALERAEKREADQAELARLRAEDEARKLRKREEQAAGEKAAADRKAKEDAERRVREAAEKATRDAEAKAAAEKQAADAEAQRERDAAAAREKALKDEAEAAKRRAYEAEAKARREAEEQAAVERAETARREADKAHRGKINRAAVAALKANGIAEDVAKAVISLIAQKEIPNVAISY